MSDLCYLPAGEALRRLKAKTLSKAGIKDGGP